MIVRRRTAGEKQSYFLGADLGAALLDNQTARQFLSTFNAANVPLCWRDIEASEGRFDWTFPIRKFSGHGKMGWPCAPVRCLLFDSRTWPDWLTLWEDDFESLRDFTAQFLRAVVERYRGKVDFWQAAGRMNTAETLSLGEEEKLRLTAMAVEIVGELDPGKPVIVQLRSALGGIHEPPRRGLSARCISPMR